MHSDTHILVTHFCNPETLSNAHGLLGCILQCNAGKNNKIPHVNREISRFLFDATSSRASSKKVGEALPISSQNLSLKAKPSVIVDFNAYFAKPLCFDSFTFDGLANKNTLAANLSNSQSRFYQVLKEKPKIKSPILARRFSLRKSIPL